MSPREIYRDWRDLNSTDWRDLNRIRMKRLLGCNGGFQ